MEKLIQTIKNMLISVPDNRLSKFSLTEKIPNTNQLLTNDIEKKAIVFTHFFNDNINTIYFSLYKVEKKLLFLDKSKYCMTVNIGSNQSLLNNKLSSNKINKAFIITNKYNKELKDLYSYIENRLENINNNNIPNISDINMMQSFVDKSILREDKLNDIL